MDERAQGEHAFTYGSLMCADIMARVCARSEALLKAEPAVLMDHARHPVRSEDYPGVRPAAGAQVPGVLYRDITPDEWLRLDAFEGADYERVRVQVWVGDALPGAPQTSPAASPLRPVQAWVYRFRSEQAHRLLPGEWSFDSFLKEGKARFVARYAGLPASPRT